ncbi:MAG: hypothetical protein LBU34_01465, partial [Planctomycetaceae bacterium]|nr:hypothetical protein [Planctomycetaceae bacterium]
YGYEPNIDNIDFVVTDKKSRGSVFLRDSGASVHYLWAEAKKGTHEVFNMFTQLILTCKKTYEKGDHLAPPWLGCFDESKIAFVSFHDMLPIFNETDFNWNIVPSNHETADFKKARKKIKKLIGNKIVIYDFSSESKEIKKFIKTHFISDTSALIKSPITKDNFVQIFIKWVKEVKPFINVLKEEWLDYKKDGILDCDFYRADVMSEGGNTITEKLKIVLKNDNYKFHKTIKGRRFTTGIDFTDNGEAYNRFWNKYERPPASVYQQYIIDRRDLLVPQNIREVKGSFFTPKIWADKSKEYLAEVFGRNWQSKYFIWDCAAGTGNLLAGLSNKYNVWASDIDEGNVETIQSLIDIDENLDLLPAHVFQFDFLNDNFDKLPAELKKIIDDPEKRKKLIIYINPPYAETMSKGIKHKAGLNQTKVNDTYKLIMGNAANRELFIQFLTRIYFEIPCCKIASFSKLKLLNAPHFVDYRKNFVAKLLKLFICPANTFDNVKGKFPIGFHIWDTNIKEHFNTIVADVFDENGFNTGTKNIFCNENEKYINEWVRSTRNRPNEKPIGFMAHLGNDFQQNNVVFIINEKKQMASPRGTWITDKNLIEITINYAVRHSIEATWLNDRDQFLYPNDKYKTDIEFQNNCLIFTLFHGQNCISSNDGINHWIPFTEKEVCSLEKFDSNFMSRFIKRNKMSTEAQDVLNAGKKLWKYYHKKIKDNKTVSVNASFYDIREFFQGRNDKGAMNTKSDDKTYNTLLAVLRKKLQILTKKIQPKVFEYGFLKK